MLFGSYLATYTQCVLGCFLSSWIESLRERVYTVSAVGKAKAFRARMSSPCLVWKTRRWGTFSTNVTAQLDCCIHLVTLSPCTAFTRYHCIAVVKCHGGSNSTSLSPGGKIGIEGKARAVRPGVIDATISEVELSPPSPRLFRSVLPSLRHADSLSLPLSVPSFLPTLGKGVSEGATAMQASTVSSRVHTSEEKVTSDWCLRRLTGGLASGRKDSTHTHTYIYACN